jgi:hypothetical protein
MNCPWLFVDICYAKNTCWQCIQQNYSKID